MGCMRYIHSERCFCENGDIGKLNKEANVNEKKRIFHIARKAKLIKEHTFARENVRDEIKEKVWELITESNLAEKDKGAILNRLIRMK